MMFNLEVSTNQTTDGLHAPPPPTVKLPHLHLSSSDFICNINFNIISIFITYANRSYSLVLY